MLPTKAVERIFERLSLTYGRDFLAMYPAGFNINDAMSLWAHELASFGQRLQDIAWALEHLPDRPPNIIQFKHLCRQAPAEDVPRLPEPKADPERLRAELAKLKPIVEEMRAKADGRNDNREWARRLIARHESGAYRSTPTALQMAKDALKVT